MAEVKGCGGSLSFTNLTAGVKQWSLNWESEVLDITDFDDNCSKAFLGGFTGWTAQATANWDAANTAKPGDSATLTLTVTSGSAYSGTAILTSMGVSQNVNGVVEATYNFQGTGALTPPA